MSTKMVAGTIIVLGLVIAGGFTSYQLWFNPINQIEFDNFGKAGDFTLTNVQGENFTFSSTEGKVRVVSWIYTSCVWGCSTITLKMSQAYDLLVETGFSDDIYFVEIDFDYIYDNLTTLANHIDIMTEYTATTLPSNYQFVWGNEAQINQSRSALLNYYIELVNTTTGGIQPLHEGEEHPVEWIHQFLVYIIDPQDNIVKLVSGLEWTPKDLAIIVEALLM